jgi:type I restriction enzyme S subunit
MGKAKTQTLTQNEFLSQALVPKEEQPYEVPDNWVWVRLVYVFTNETSSKKKLQQADYLEDGQFAVVDQGKDLIGGYTNDENLLYNGVLPAIVFGDHTRIVKFIDFPFVQGADGVKVLCPNAFVDSKFFYYSMQNIDIPDLGYRRHFPLFPQINLPLPPITEQKRIFKFIGNLFDKLDRAKELVQNALGSFETRKAAILHKVFTGELTAKWRMKNGVGEKSWRSCTLQSVCQINPKRMRIDNYADDLEVTFVPMPAVSELSGQIESPQIKHLGEVKKGYTNFNEGDVIFAKITPCMENGKSAIVKSLKNGIGFGSTEFHVLRCSPELNNHYLHYILRNQKFKDEAQEVIPEL